jgi:transposase
LFRERTGITWRDLPERFGPWKTVYQRKRRWAIDGTWAAICSALRIDCDLAEGNDWTVGVDSSIVRAHQHAAGARHAPAGDHPDKGGSGDRAKRTGKRSGVPAVG